MKDSKLTNQVKEYAYKLGADLVGVANIERFEKAPIMMSPQGILPAAKSVIVCAVHHLDACIELGGEPEPQNVGPYKVQYVMNDKLDLISFKIGRFLDDLGYKAVPIAASNIWRYRSYKELTAVFAPDMSHIYAATAAGLGELGWHGLTMTPEYGARNRFVSIITDAELEPTPLYNGPKLCDMCGECIKNCPTNAYRMETKEPHCIEFEDKKYKFCNKNLWRCAWGEHFDLDLNLKIPDVVTEEVILENVKKYGLRGGEMGVCLRVCLPSHLRLKDPSYTKVNRRKRHFIPGDNPVHRSVVDKVINIASNNYIDYISFINREQLKEKGIELARFLPDGKSAAVLGIEFKIPKGNKTFEEMLDQYKQIAEWQCYSATEKDTNVILNQYKEAAQFLLDFSAMDAGRELEKLGYTAVVKTDIDSSKLAHICGIEEDDKDEYTFRMYETIICSANFATANYTNGQKISIDSSEKLWQSIEKACYDAGADLVGVSSAARINSVVGQLKKVKEGEEILMAMDQNTRFATYIPSVSKINRKLLNAQDYLKNAKSVIILGLHYPETVVERAQKPPAEAIGPYVFTQFETQRLLGHMGLAVAKHLNNLGYEAVYTYDLTGLGSQVGSPRGLHCDATCNAVEAVAAGLGELTYNGTVFTEKYGTNQRFIAIITDADLNESNLNYSGKIEQYCSGCTKCLDVCPTRAILKDKKVQIEIEGNSIGYVPMDTNRCDWSSKYALCGDDGFRYIGCKTNEMPDGQITAETLAKALENSDPVLKHRPVTAQNCIVKCPLTNGEYLKK